MGIIDNQVEEIELEINQAKEKVSLRDSLEKLIKNKDFKKVITEGYFEQEAIRLVLLKADPSMQSEQGQKDILSRIESISQLRQYFMYILQQGSMAERAIVEAQETREELLNEQIDEPFYSRAM